jgi:hypothetical protein
MAAPDADLDDETFLAQFEARTLPFDRWTHRMHVRLAWCYLRQGPLQEALARVRSGIQQYNLANARTGYHETMTVIWVRLVDSAVRNSEPAADSRAFCDAHPHLMSAKVPLLFYRRSLINSPEAKEHFVEPDLTALPR